MPGTAMTGSRAPVQIRRQRDGTFRLTTGVLLLDTPERVFQFVSDIDNLEMVIPSWLALRLVTPRRIAMGRGTRIDYRLRIHGVPTRWESEITSWDPPRRFVYEQRRGPFKHWVHEHTIVDQRALCARGSAPRARPARR
jgi:ligand-binding SRPBCC domain-containing protein